MKTTWDYTQLAKAYVNRPDYATDAIDKMVQIVELHRDSYICDVGAGTAHLTIPMLQRGFRVVAVEPNDAMRELGRLRTEKWDSVSWFEGTGEETKQSSNTFDLVTFGSSFNVTNRSRALEESHRILKENGWFACMWNHRDLQDDLQNAVEKIIFSYIPEYNYGSRREDQTEIIVNSGLFNEPIFVTGKIDHHVPKSIWLEAWASHATLARQAQEQFPKIIEEIEHHVAKNIKEDVIVVPYTTKIWIAQKK